MVVLRSGYVLCQLARTINPSVVSKLEGVYKYPVKEARVTNLFQSIENTRWYAPLVAFCPPPSPVLIRECTKLPGRLQAHWSQGCGPV